MTETSFSFLGNGGDSGKQIREHNWSQSPPGSPEQWPPALRTMLSLVLNSPLPTAVWWRPELIQFYDDSLQQALHPEKNLSIAPGSACLNHDEILMLPIGSGISNA